MVPDVIFIALQLTRVDLNEQTMGSFITAIDVKVHSDVCEDPFDGQVSSNVRLPLNVNVKFSTIGSDEGLDVAFTELSTSQVLPITLMLVPNILVFFDTAAFYEIMMWVELLPYFC